MGSFRIAHILAVHVYFQRTGYAKERQDVPFVGIVNIYERAIDACAVILFLTDVLFAVDRALVNAFQSVDGRFRRRAQIRIPDVGIERRFITVPAPDSRHGDLVEFRFFGIERIGNIL